MVIFRFVVLLFIIVSVSKAAATDDNSGYSYVCKLVEDLDKTYANLEKHLEDIPYAIYLLVLLKDYRNKGGKTYLILYRGCAEEDFKGAPPLALPVIYAPSTTRHLIKGLSVWLAKYTYFDVYHIASTKYLGHALCRRCTQRAFNYFGIVDLVASPKGCPIKPEFKRILPPVVSAPNYTQLTMADDADNIIQQLALYNKEKENEAKQRANVQTYFSIGSLVVVLYALAKGFKGSLPTKQ